MLNDILVASGCIVANIGLCVCFKPQPAPLSHCVIAAMPNLHAPIFREDLLHPRFAFSFGSSREALLNRLSGFWVQSKRKSDLPAAIAPLSKAALSIAPFLFHTQASTLPV